MQHLKIKSSDRCKFIVLKKDYIVYKAVRGAIVQLLLPAGTTISVPRDYDLGTKYHHRRKLRADQAVVLAIIPRGVVYRPSPTGAKPTKLYLPLEDVNKAYESKWKSSFKYRMGELVKPKGKGFNMKSNQACKAGIHFFTNVEDAERWQ